jgi:hypothetical protein
MLNRAEHNVEPAIDPPRRLVCNLVYNILDPSPPVNELTRLGAEGPHKTHKVPQPI